METETVRTLAEFTNLIEQTCVDQSEVLFRGRPCEWSLLPSLARERLTDDVLAVEKSMLDEFQRHSLPYLRVTPATTWDWLALGQHHGLPTRLLDWSQNPLTSLWFAVSRPAHEGENGIVWVFRPGGEDFPSEAEKDSLECKRHMVFAPKHLSERITAQVAYFTVHKCWTGGPAFEPLEESEELGAKLTKVTIPADRFAHLRFNLDRCGVNHASVFPGLDGLCSHIKWKRCFLQDEGDPEATQHGVG
jgi:hypothetical protein